MESLDLDKDGHISFEEFKAGFQVCMLHVVIIGPECTVHVLMQYQQLSHACYLNVS